MNITMRISHLAACCLVALAPGLACAAISLAPPSLPPCAFADTESSSNFVFCTGTGLDRNWILSVEADVTSNNNVQVEFGVDRDVDISNLFSPEWNMARVVVRGERPVGEVVKSVLFPHPFVLRLR